MRVIAGEARGRRLKSGKGDKARPTSDRVKEALFNILANYVVDAEFLDLFAGFGGIGIEAISRGCKEVTFVEQDHQHIRIIQENLKMVGFMDGTKVIKGDVTKILSGLDQEYDLIYLDPPYDDKGLYEKTLELIWQNSLLKGNGIIICEHRKEYPPKRPAYLELLKYKNYGDTGLTFFGLKGIREERQE